MSAWIVANVAWIGWGASELLGLVPSIKSNSVVQAVVSCSKAVIDALASALSGNAPKMP